VLSAVILVALALAFALMGIGALVSPTVVTRQFGIPALTPEGRSEVRAVYGGFGLPSLARSSMPSSTPTCAKALPSRSRLRSLAWQPVDSSLPPSTGPCRRWPRSTSSSRLSEAGSSLSLVRHHRTE